LHGTRGSNAAFIRVVRGIDSLITRIHFDVTPLNSNLMAERAGLPTFRVEHKAIPKSIPDVEAQQRLKGDQS